MFIGEVLDRHAGERIHDLNNWKRGRVGPFRQGKGGGNSIHFQRRGGLLMLDRYRSSGRCPATFLMAAIPGLVLAAVVGVVYELAVHYIPLI